MAVFLLLTIFLISIFLILIFRKDKLSHIPGPKGVPVLGNLLQLDLENLHRDLTEQMKKYGSIIKIKLLNDKIVVVNGPKEIHQVLVSKGNDFSGRPSSFRTKEAYKNSPSFSDYTDNVRESKKILMSYMKVYGKGIKEAESLILSAVKMLMGKLEVYNSEQQIDIRTILNTSLIDMIYVLMFQCHAPQEEINIIDKMFKLDEQLFEFGGEGTLLDMFPWIRYIKSPLYEKFLEMDELENTLYTKWKQEYLKPGAQRTLISCYFEHNRKNPSLALSDQMICRSLSVVFLAGITTSTVTLLFLINRLAQDEELQNKLYEENKRVLGGRQVSIDDKENMPFHEAAIAETSRYCCLTPFMVPHKAVKDTSINDYKIPKGTQIWINLFSYTHDEALWDEPYAFKPERFLTKDGKLDNEQTKKNSYIFSGGPRICPGETFAKMRLFLVLSSILQKYEILPATTKEEQPSCDINDAVIGTLLYPQEFKIRLKPRNNTN